jgi:UDP-N-acetylmuramate: L-alanyl-gamma-D-glutamyl-meso-diaminopimelate ligase
MHVLRSAGKDFDYLVGARLEGFDQSVNITDAQLIVCEGDEYPASALERRPKFHFLAPHIAVLTGIAWDHINVFPTFENYLEQFTIFLDKIEQGGTVIYNETDETLRQLVQQHGRKDIHYLPYGVPQHTIENGETSAVFDGAHTKLKVFGAHNLLNMHAAWLVCRELGMDAATFTKAIATFTGAAKRLEVLAKTGTVTVFRDFAHAPSKVAATLSAVRAQFPERRLVAVLELHTYSSLSEAFLTQYAGAMDGADDAAVFYSRHALELKRLPELSERSVSGGFGRIDLKVLNEREELERWLKERTYEDTVLLLMSSGNYDGMDLNALVQQVTGTAN